MRILFKEEEPQVIGRGGDGGGGGGGDYGDWGGGWGENTESAAQAAANFGLANQASENVSSLADANTAAAAQMAADFGLANQAAANQTALANTAFVDQFSEFATQPPAAPLEDTQLAEANKAALPASTAHTLVDVLSAVVETVSGVIGKAGTLAKEAADVVNGLIGGAKEGVKTGIDNVVNARDAADTRDAAAQNPSPGTSNPGPAKNFIDESVLAYLDAPVVAASPDQATVHRYQGLVDGAKK